MNATWPGATPLCQRPNAVQGSHDIDDFVPTMPNTDKPHQTMVQYVLELPSSKALIQAVGTPFLSDSMEVPFGQA